MARNGGRGLWSGDSLGTASIGQLGSVLAIEPCAHGRRRLEVSQQPTMARARRSMIEATE